MNLLKRYALILTPSYSQHIVQIEEKKFIDLEDFAQLAFDLSDLHKLETASDELRKQQQNLEYSADLPFHKECSVIVLNPWFETTINSLLVLNGVVFALQTYYFVTDINSFYDHQTIWLVGEYSFATIWVLEMSLKIYVLSFTGYLSSKANIFDATIIILGLVCHR